MNMQQCEYIRVYRGFHQNQEITITKLSAKILFTHLYLLSIPQAKVDPSLVIRKQSCISLSSCSLPLGTRMPWGWIFEGWSGARCENAKQCFSNMDLQMNSFLLLAISQNKLTHRRTILTILSTDFTRKKLLIQRGYL